mmetsp:Transcript_56311/g.164595  ORF Transcript_56311/g.164595 Transcript_56311/m.164595 type:complete len:202 (-) Transcript_56311:708-1313(-)
MLSTSLLGDVSPSSFFTIWAREGRRELPERMPPASGSAQTCTLAMWARCMSEQASTKRWWKSSRGMWLMSSPKGVSSSFASSFIPHMPSKSRKLMMGPTITDCVKQATYTGTKIVKQTIRRVSIWAKGNGKGTSAIFIAWLNPSMPLDSSWYILDWIGAGVSRSVAAPARSWVSQYMTTVVLSLELSRTVLSVSGGSTQTL